MKRILRIRLLILSIGITVLGILFTADWSGPVIGITMIVVGLACTTAMSYTLFGQKKDN